MNKQRLKELLAALAMGRRDVVDELVEVLTGKEEAPVEPKPAAKANK